MIISEVIKMLEEAKTQYGDVEVYADTDYGQREVERNDDLLCKSPAYEVATSNLPERIVI